MDFESALLEHLPREEVDALLASLGQDSVHSFILDVDKCSEESLLALYPHLERHPFLEHVFYYDKKEYDLGKSMLYDLGAISIQDSASMLAPHYLDPKPGERVLDLCAAPGGKTIFAALRMKKTGLIVSNDLSYPRAKALSQNIERMGIGNAVVTNDDFEAVYKDYLEQFDCVLLDAPCSGSAMFRKNKEAEEDWSYEKVLRCAEIQSKLLQIAYAVLRKGGRLLYSTCSFSKEENEDNVLSFIANHDDMHLVDIEQNPCYFRPKAAPEAIYLFPHRYKGEGQFMALFTKDGEGSVVREAKSKSEKTSKELQAFLQKFHLENLQISKKGETTYGIALPIEAKRLHILRYGIEIGADGKFFLPSHALARCLPSTLAIPLSKEETLKYLQGETFPSKGEDGFQLVAYEKMTLGWVKIVNGMAKNHYPKGLRYRYQ